MKIPFDIKYKPQIESGEYKVIYLDYTEEESPARIICWDRHNEHSIVALISNSGGYERVQMFQEEGIDNNNPHLGKLFIVTSEEELTEFEKACMKLYNEGRDDGFSGDKLSNESVKESASELLSLAREQFIKDGYIIEKKTFHDTVEKVDQDVMKEVSENIDFENLIHNLSERYPEVSFAKLTRIAKVAYQKGKAEALKDLSK